MGRSGHTRIRNADYHAESGAEERADELYRRVVGEGKASGRETAMAYRRELRQKVEDVRQQYGP